MNPRRVQCGNFVRKWLWNQSQVDLLEFPELHKAYLSISDVEFSTALCATPRFAIDQVDSLGRTLLSWASEKGDFTIVAQLLACGADPHVTDSSGLNSLHYAVKSSSEKCVRLLLVSKADPEARTIFGTPLHYAAANGTLGALQALLEFGADVNVQGNAGWRPIHDAIAQDRPHCFKQLLDAGADVLIQIQGLTTLDISIAYNSHSSLKALLEVWKQSARTKDDVRPDVHISLVA